MGESIKDQDREIRRLAAMADRANGKAERAQGAADALHEEANLAVEAWRSAVLAAGNGRPRVVGAEPGEAVAS